MSTVISFISRKGGTGKTTNALLTATVLFDTGKKVVFVETDPNYTVNTLRRIELFKKKLDPDDYFPIVGSDDDGVVDYITSLQKKNKYDFIIVDSAGKATDSHIKSLCLESDIVVVPTSLTQNDLLVAYQTIEDLKPAKRLKKNLRIIVLPNRIHSATKQKTIDEALASLDAEILKPFLPSKVIYAKASTLKSIKGYDQIVDSLLQK